MTQITRFNILATALAGLNLALSISYFFIFLPYHEYFGRTADLKQHYISEEKKAVRHEVERALKELEFLTQDHLEEVATNLSLNLAYIESVLESKNFTDYDYTQQKLAQMRQEMAQLHRAAYIIVDSSAQIVGRSNDACFRNLGFASTLSDAKMAALLEPLWTAKPKRLTQISWPALDTSAPLNSYALYSHTDEKSLRIVVLIPQSISDKYLQTRFLERLSQVRYGTDSAGYFFIFDANAQWIMNPFHTPAYTQDLTVRPVKDEHKDAIRRLTETAQTGGGFVEYTFINQLKDSDTEDNTEEKTAYVSILPRWNWTVGTGFYTSALYQRINAQQQNFLATTHKRARIGVAVVLLNLLLGLIIAGITNRHISKIEGKREEHYKRLQQYGALLDELCLVSKGDLEGNITYANDQFCRVSGYKRDEMLGQPHNMVRHPSVPKTVFKRMWQHLQAGKTWRGISRNKTKDGNSYYADSVIMPLTDQNGNVTEYIAARYEITELLEKRDEVKLAFATDRLTSLGSRYKLLEDIGSGVADKCLLLFDIVDFGGINHNLGTEAADEALRHFSNQMMEFFTAESYILYRLHSDIFAVLTQSTQTEEITSTVERFSEFLRQHSFLYAAEERLNLTFTSAIAWGEQDLLTCADAALQYAKQHKQELAIYNPQIAKQQGRMRAYWINEVQQALLEQRLMPYYQPIVHISSGKTTRYEALMRMHNVGGEVISPGEFLPIMEQTSHYPAMTHTIFKQACMFFHDRQEGFSVNLSVDDLLRRNTVSYIATIAKRYAVCDRLVLELVETENIQNYDTALKALLELKAMGIHVAIDDFGTGFANFAYLSAFPADFVKIDGSLISKINEDEKTRNLVQVLIDYAHSEGMEVIAEFVSSAAIFDTVRNMGCDYAQGYHFGAPIPGDKLDS